MRSEKDIQTFPESDAAALVSQGAALLRIQNDSMLQIAVQRPRNERKIVDAAIAELDLVPEEAALAFYTIPYEERTPDGKVKIRNVTGPSIKAASALARRWGNCSVGAVLAREDGAADLLEGYFIDLETNYRIARPLLVRKTYRTRRGDVIPVREDRLPQVFGAGVSKVVRNAIIAGLPAYLVSAYDKKARALAAGGPLDAPATDKQREAVIRGFERWEIGKEALIRYLEIPVEQWTGTEIGLLRGLWNALHDGQLEPSEVFGAAEAPVAVVTPLDRLAGEKPALPTPTEAPAPAADVERTSDETLSRMALLVRLEQAKRDRADTPGAVPAGTATSPPPAADVERAALIQDIHRAFAVLKWKPEVTEHLVKRRLGTKDYAAADLGALADLRKEVVAAVEKQSHEAWK